MSLVSRISLDWIYRIIVSSLQSVPIFDREGDEQELPTHSNDPYTASSVWIYPTIAYRSRLVSVTLVPRVRSARKILTTHIRVPETSSSDLPLECGVRRRASVPDSLVGVRW